jgi:DNA-binding transcriptional MerR regulator
MTMTISKPASQAGVSAHTLRYYQRIGLLPAPGRTEAGYRLFDEDSVDRLRFIKGAQRMGLRLDDIKALLEAWDKGMCPCGHTEALLRQRMGAVEAEITRLAQLRDSMANMLERYPPQCEEEAPWPCQVDFIERGKEVSASG